MKVVGSRLVKVAFNKLWRLSGSPKLRLIEPIANWELPTGTTYNARHDQFMALSRAVVNVDWTDQPYLELPFLSKPQQNDVEVGIPGVITMAKTSITLLWSAETQAALAVAWGVTISGKLYRVERWQLIPLGVSTSNSIDVDLVEAKKGNS